MSQQYSMARLFVGEDLVIGGTLRFTDTAWDDIVFPAAYSKKGANAKPDYDYTNLGDLYPQNDATEITYYQVQMPHRWKAGSAIEPHVHFVQAQATMPVFKLAYRTHANGAAVTSDWTTITCDAAGAFPYTSGSITQIVGFPSIAMTGLAESCLIDVKLWREDNAVTGDVLVKQFDIHYEIDKTGSDNELPT